MVRNKKIILKFSFFLSLTIFILYYYFIVKKIQHVTNTQQAYHKHVYFDIGANKGDSIRNFFYGHKKMSENFLSNYELDKPWIIFAIEPNPVFSEYLNLIRFNLSKFNNTVNVYSNIMPWIYDGEVELNFNTLDSNFYHLKPKISQEDIKQSDVKLTKRPCLDLARLIKQFQKNDLIVVKLDVKGAEYDILPHLQAQNALNLIDFINVTFYSSSSHKTKNDDFYFHEMIKKNGVKEYFQFY